VDDALNAEERGLVAGLLLLGVGDSLPVGQVLQGGRWSEVLGRLRALDEGQRAGALSALLRGLGTPREMEPDGPLGIDLAGRPDLVVELTRRGARTLGESLAGAPLELRARAMAAAGAPWAAEIAAAAVSSQAEARDRARTLVARAARIPESTPETRLRALGVLSVAVPLARESPRSLAAVAARLPAELSRLLLSAARE
jgi:hypothetical protein